MHLKSSQILRVYSPETPGQDDFSVLDNLDEQLYNRLPYLVEVEKVFNEIVRRSQLQKDYPEPEDILAEDICDMVRSLEGFYNEKVCEECGQYPADAPSKLCCGCNAYKDHL